VLIRRRISVCYQSDEGGLHLHLASSFQCVSDVMTRRHKLSAATSQLIVPTTRCSALGDRAFPVTAAHAWNALPHLVASAPTLTTFSRLLKTHPISLQFLFIVVCLSNVIVQCPWSGFHCVSVTLILSHMNEWMNEWMNEYYSSAWARTR